MNVEHAVSFPVEKFLFVFAIILIASKVIGELTERIKQPPVLGELIAGVLLGGSVLALIPSVSGQPGYETFHLLAELGVVILLFEIGLETDLNELLEKSDYLILVTDHKEFKKMDLDRLKENSIKVIIDGRNCLDKEKIKSMGILYRGIGRS